MNKPHINVTPLIDVLLVLLIIFMVVTPLKPSSLKTRVPSDPPKLDHINTNPKILIVFIGVDSSLSLDTETDLGTVGDPSNLIRRLKEVFDERIANGDVSDYFADDSNRPFQDRIERTVFIKAPKHLAYGQIASVVDAVKFAGAYPISLQIDDL